MRYAPLLAVIAFGAVFGWFSPPPQAASESSSGHRAREPREQIALANTAQWNAGEVLLPREADGHFYADVTVDSVTSRMLVDTGASVIALTGEDAEAMGVAWSPDEVKPVAQGANGLVYGVNVTLDRVQIGDVEARQVRATVVPEGLGISLLGQSFLGQIGRVEIGDQGMVLGG
jgi:aspartyl protease family protein